MTYVNVFDIVLNRKTNYLYEYMEIINIAFNF
jgi:hypothetical protein